MKKTALFLGLFGAGVSISAAAATVLFDFETEDEQKTAPRVFAHDRTICVTNAFATSGQHALYFKSGPWRKGLDEWPNFNLHTSVKDWRGYDRLVIDLVSAGEGNDTLSTFISGPEGRVQNGLHAQTTLPARGYAQWVIPLRNWPKKCDPANISRVHIFLSNPRDARVFIDRLTLLKKDEPLPVPDGPCVGRDLISLLTDGRDAMRRELVELQEWQAHARDFLRFFEACQTSGLASPAMLLGTATSMEKIMPRGRFSARPVSKEGLSVRLAGNEYESVQLLVAPRGADLEDVRVRVDGDLTSCANRGSGAPAASFSAANIACDVTGYVKTTRQPPYKVGEAVSTNAVPGYARATRSPVLGWWPEPILGFLDGIAIRDLDVQSFWIRVHCPAGQPAGTYRGALLVSAKGVETVRVPFAVRVNGFTLGRTSALPLAVTFGPSANTQHESPETIAYAAALRADPLAPINIWRKHKREWVSFLADYLIPYDSLYHHSDTNRLDAIRQLKEEGRSGWFNLGYWSYPKSTNEVDMAKWREGTIPRLKRFYEGAKKIGVQDYAYVYGCDEVNKEYFPAIRAAVKELKQALPGVPISTTAYDHEFGVGTPLDVMDWFTPLTPKFDPEKAAKSRAAGHQVWWYICCGPHAPHANMFIECPAIEGRLLMGAQTVRQRPDGFLYYQISIWNSKRCITSGPFTDWDPRSWTKYHGDGSWTCVGPDGTPLPTVRLENFRDGLEDYAYALLLEKKLKSHADPNDAWAKRARELLAVPRDVMDTMRNYTGDPAAVYRWRDAMADLLENHCGE
ncbi:MAG: DUF4091 domain-containing protein [Kiritimatiellae bacterium]|nr:DUF4091 domain-containing protein [Kiritimatiellia bacterium]